MRNRPSVTWNNFHITYGKWPSNKKKVFIYVETLHRLSQLIPQCIHLLYILHVLAFNHHNIPFTIPRKTQGGNKDRKTWIQIDSICTCHHFTFGHTKDFFFFFDFYYKTSFFFSNEKETILSIVFEEESPFSLLRYIKTTVPHLFDVLYFIVRKNMCIRLYIQYNIEKNLV